MASKIRTILGNFETRLASINGAGGYVHDLSGTGKVQLGRPTPADGSPTCCWYYIDEVASVHGPQMGRYRRDLNISIEARAATDTDDTEERELIAADLLDDLLMALEADRTLSGQVLDLIATGSSFAGESTSQPGYATAFVEVNVYWHANSGAGV